MLNISSGKLFLLIRTTLETARLLIDDILLIQECANKCDWYTSVLLRRFAILDITYAYVCCSVTLLPVVLEKELMYVFLMSISFLTRIFYNPAIVELTCFDIQNFLIICLISAFTTIYYIVCSLIKTLHIWHCLILNLEMWIKSST